jgi:hypothetical protein
MRLNPPAYAALLGLMPAWLCPDWYNATARMPGKVRGIPIVSYCETGTCSSSRGRARAPAHSTSRLLAHRALLLQYQTPRRRRRRQRLVPHANQTPLMTTTTTSTHSLKRAWHANWHWMALLSYPPTSAHYLRRVYTRSTTTTTNRAVANGSAASRRYSSSWASPAFAPTRWCSSGRRTA